MRRRKARRARGATGLFEAIAGEQAAAAARVQERERSESAEHQERAATCTLS
jgi:hypothetical protein